MKKLMMLVLAISFVLIGCGRADLELEDGTYSGIGEGYQGEIEVEVTVEDEEISSVEILEHEESDGTSDPAFDEIPEQIAEAQSYEVDTVSGATGTSEGIIAAVEDALADAEA